MNSAEVRCNDCGAQSGTFDVDDGRLDVEEQAHNDAEAIAAWNRRAPAADAFPPAVTNGRLDRATLALLDKAEAPAPPHEWHAHRAMTFAEWREQVRKALEAARG